MLPLFLVDGFNVLHAVVLSGRERSAWWGAHEQGRVVELAERFDGEVCVVFDERGSERIARSERVDVEFAPNADDYIVERCGQLRGLRQVVVVSADRSLGDRSLQRGASRLSPWKFAERCQLGGEARR
jgi:predicted RNA-binding protein with PIN domain